jgi:hypothetical protein
MKRGTPPIDNEKAPGGQREGNAGIAGRSPIWSGLGMNGKAPWFRPEAFPFNLESAYCVKCRYLT